ncbi:L-seryl-tRNA(Sec) kinase [Spea bombifrons]|uniref:L-seryl-tRNA(Sec) kinase n=1 Tax=Spea bombifrons TaxID=233779 RepID=UPI00234BABA0|nr:L-seryl-tRNA(Sec) kinase [Spea bombifrons]
MRRLAICLLCGLPGSGKSTLARSLEKHWLSESVFVITYDDVITADSFAEGPRRALGESREISSLSAEPERDETSVWKQHRQHILGYLEHLIVAVLNSSGLVCPESRSEETWHRFVDCLARQGLVSPARLDDGSPCHITNIPENNATCLVLDDNFYYQSMRYEVYQLACKYSLGFCQIYLQCPVECCLMRNRSRAVPVPDQTIWLMEKKMEIPNPRKNTWEQNSLVLDSSALTEENPGISDLLKEAVENPLRPLQEDSKDKDKDRAVCAANILHQADQSLRRSISETMQSVKGTISVQEMKLVAQELHGAKSRLLEQLKQSMSQKELLAFGAHTANDTLFLFKEQTEHIVYPYLCKAT